jgi:hypothetical protein
VTARPSVVVASIALGAALVVTCADPAPAPPRGERPTLFVTGSDDGYLEACGCDDGLLGGLARRRTLLKELGGDGDQGLLLSNGRLVVGRSPLDGMKLQALLFAMLRMGYDGIALSERELALGRAVLRELAGSLEPGCPLLATNLRDDGTPRLPLHASVVQEVAKSKVLVLAAIGKSRAELFRAADPKVEVTEPAAALQAEVDAHADVDHVVVLAQATIGEASELAKALPRVELVVVQGSDEEEDPKTKELHAGSAAIVTTGRKGRFVVSWRFAGGDAPGEYRRDPVVDTLDKDADVDDVVQSYYRARLKDDEPPPIAQYLEQRPTASGARYAGAAEGSCAGCHPKAWATWAASRHSRAWQALVDQDLPPSAEPRTDGKREKPKLVNAIWDPDCVKCHVTGFGEVSGWAGLEKEKAREKEGAPLVNVTCEACHGPAGDHAERAQNGDSSYPSGHAPRMPPTAGELAGGAKPLSIPELERAEAFCMRCHDPDNSPAFVLAEYWRGLVRGEPRESVAHGKE